MSEEPVAIVPAQVVGSAPVCNLSARGYRLALMSRSGCREIAEELGALAVAGSVLDDTDARSLVDQTMERKGRP